MARQGKRHTPKRCEAPDAPVKQMLCGRNLAPNDDPALAPCLVCLDVALAMAYQDMANEGNKLAVCADELRAGIRQRRADAEQAFRKALYAMRDERSRRGYERGRQWLG